MDFARTGALRGLAWLRRDSRGLREKVRVGAIVGFLLPFGQIVILVNDFLVGAVLVGGCFSWSG